MFSKKSFTANIRSVREGNIFSLFVCSHGEGRRILFGQGPGGGGGVLPPSQTGPGFDLQGRGRCVSCGLSYLKKFRYFPGNV